MSPSKLAIGGLAGPVDLYAEPNVESYWPLSFLPASCPNARVFTWGYHTLAADKKPLRGEGDIFAHAEELLVELASTRAEMGAGARPIVFIAHSTGGLLVKEVMYPETSPLARLTCVASPTVRSRARWAPQRDPTIDVGRHIPRRSTSRHRTLQFGRCHPKHGQHHSTHRPQ